jgi:hypothetical protein
MNFGDVVPDVDASGTVVLSTISGRSVTGAVTTQGAVAAAAEFTVRGEVDATYSVTLPSGPVELNLADDSSAMEVTAFTSAPGTGAGSGSLENAGMETLLVGATLNVGANQAAGDYEGEFEVTVAYN